MLNLLFYFIVLLVLRQSQLGRYGNTAIIFKIFQKVKLKFCVGNNINVVSILVGFVVCLGQSHYLHF